MLLSVLKLESYSNFTLIWPPKPREAIALADTVTYTYDDLNRLTQAAATSVASGQSTYTQNFTYNAIGNITAGPVGSYTYAGTGYANPHAATSINSVTNTYDNDGNLTGDGTWTHGWNYKNQLTSSDDGTNVIAYTYDENGNRVKLDDGTTTTVYPNKYYNYDGTKKTKSIYAGDQLVATIETVGGVVTPYYDHVDHLNSVSTVSDSNGALVQTLDFMPYGAERINSGSYSSQKAYVGQMHDNLTSLNYLNARYQNGLQGRFISEDPSFLALGDEKQTEATTKMKLQDILKNPQTLNSYSYANSNPVTLSDPQGKFAPALGVFAIPVIGEAAIVGGIAVFGSYAIYEGTKTAINFVKNNDWGSISVPGPYRTVNEKTSGLNQSPGGPEDWEPKNLGNAPKWMVNILKGGVAASIVKEVYDQVKEKVDFSNEFNSGTKTENSIQNQNKSTQTNSTKTESPKRSQGIQLKVNH